MKRRLINERGFALVTAILITAIMLAVGLATISWADNGFRTSAEERMRESGFNLADTVLDAQIYQLGRNWPNASSQAPVCTQGAETLGCPSKARIEQSFTGPDYPPGGYEWSTVVQDNGPPVSDFYTTAAAEGQPHYDRGGPAGANFPDGKVWVRAEATVRGKTRRLLGEVQAREVPLPFPTNAITAGRFRTGNSGNKTIIDTIGNSFQSGDVSVRCTTLTLDCVNYDAQKRQIEPDTTHIGYTGGDAMSAEDLNSLRGRAQAKGTYYLSCPPSPDPNGDIVFVESGNCSYTGQSPDGNPPPAQPGMFVINSGTLTLDGNFEYYGLIYAHNAGPDGTSATGLTGDVVSIQGTALVHGAVAVDGAGGVSVGSSSLNLIYDFNVFSRVLGFGTGELTPGTWRELGPN